MENNGSIRDERHWELNGTSTPADPPKRGPNRTAHYCTGAYCFDCLPD